MFLFIFSNQKLTKYSCKNSVNTEACFECEVSKYGEKVDFATGQYEALVGADALIICTEWNEFRTPDFKKIASSLKSMVIFDGRNLYNLSEAEDEGFYYESIGRRVIKF